MKKGNVIGYIFIVLGFLKILLSILFYLDYKDIVAIQSVLDQIPFAEELIIVIFSNNMIQNSYAMNELAAFSVLLINALIFIGLGIAINKSVHTNQMVQKMYDRMRR